MKAFTGNAEKYECFSCQAVLVSLGGSCIIVCEILAQCTWFCSIYVAFLGKMLLAVEMWRGEGASVKPVEGQCEFCSKYYL
jgi:hypothetical protein